jgi:hypothetical protein
VSCGKSEKSYRAKSAEYGGCEIMVIFFVAKNSHTGKVECIVLVENPILSNVGLQFVFVQKLCNAWVHEC